MAKELQNWRECLRNFEDAARELGKAWEAAEYAGEDIPVKNYPFDESFDEVVLGIIDYRTDAEEFIRKATEKKAEELLDAVEALCGGKGSLTIGEAQRFSALFNEGMRDAAAIVAKLRPTPPVNELLTLAQKLENITESADASIGDNESEVLGYVIDRLRKLGEVR